MKYLPSLLLLLALTACSNKQSVSATDAVSQTITQMTEKSTPREVSASTDAAPVTEESAEVVASTDAAPAPKTDNAAPAGDVDVLIKTSMGDITVRLFADTPIHRDNFVKLVKDGYYDGVLFHRVINDFMVQTGDGNSKNAPAGKMLGDGDPGYTLEAEFVYPKHFHKRGALAAARQGDNVNPQRRSSGSQFYIVTGKAFSEGQLNQMEQQMQMAAAQDIFNRIASEHRNEIMEMRRNRDTLGLQNLQEQLIALTEAESAKHPVKFTEEQRKAYTTVGGTPHLDGAYTVFGEVLKGMDVVDAIQKVETDRNDRPVNDVKIISMKILN